ncbi:hypothetical protein E2C01_067262 [Portunus trituberculatus]|uniref:Uncharacterized protein n=1 Tax=Portunus trituberculatus TaxID=210409 RepID=A0A5B7HW75_PORTR|nr:hypothetical protein [Portunus trituberculatus]
MASKARLRSEKDEGDTAGVRCCEPRHWSRASVGRRGGSREWEGGRVGCAVFWRPR